MAYFHFWRTNEWVCIDYGRLRRVRVREGSGGFHAWLSEPSSVHGYVTKLFIASKDEMWGVVYRWLLQGFKPDDEGRFTEDLV